MPVRQRFDCCDCIPEAGIDWPSHLILALLPGLYMHSLLCPGLTEAEVESMAEMFRPPAPQEPLSTTDNAEDWPDLAVPDPAGTCLKAACLLLIGAY